MLAEDERRVKVGSGPNTRGGAAVVVLPRVSDGFDPVGWALRTVVADGFDLVLMLSFHGGGRA